MDLSGLISQLKIPMVENQLLEGVDLLPAAAWRSAPPGCGYLMAPRHGPVPGVDGSSRSVGVPNHRKQLHEPCGLEDGAWRLAPITV